MISWLSLSNWWAGIGIGLLSSILIFRKPFLGLVLFTALIPLEEFTAINSSFTITKLFGALTFIAWIFHLIKSKEKVKANNVFWVILLFFGWASLSSFWAINKNLSLARIPMLIQLAGLYLICINLIKTRKGLNLVLGSFLAGSIVASFICLFNICTRPLWILNPKDSTLLLFVSTCSSQWPNVFARVIGIGLLFSLLFLGETKRWPQRIFLIVISSLFILLITKVQQRGAWIVLPLAWLSQISLGKFRFKETFFILLLIVFVIFVGLKTNFLPKGNHGITNAALSIIDFNATTHSAIKKIVTKFQELTKMKKMTPTILLNIPQRTEWGGRTYIWKVGWEIIKANPFLGVGLLNFGIAHDIYCLKLKSSGIVCQWGAGPHSDVVGITAETGIVGLLLFLFIFILTYQHIRKEGKSRTVIYAVILIGFIFAAGLSTTDHYRKFYWLALAISYLLPRLKTKALACKATVCERPIGTNA